MLHVTYGVAWSFGGNAMRYALAVSWMTSSFRIMERIGQNQRRRRRVCFVQFARWHHRERSLPSPPALMKRHLFKMKLSNIDDGYCNEFDIGGVEFENDQFSSSSVLVMEISLVLFQVLVN